MANNTSPALGALLALPPAYSVWLNSQHGTNKATSLAFTCSLGALAFAWYTLVSGFVPEPYMDEIFHVPQAQAYCRGKFDQWDDKLTTPPGLYLLSLPIQKALSFGLSAETFCDSASLRVVNSIALSVLSLLAVQCRQAIESRLNEARGLGELNVILSYTLHTAFNIGLFPVLFFFSGLYYTDIVSTVTVLAAYLNHLRRMEDRSPSLASNILTIVLGIVTLTMRQTNVFWVVVYMGGLEATHAIRTLRFEQPKDLTQDEDRAGGMRAAHAAIKQFAAGFVHDPPVSSAYPDDVVFTTMSFIVAALANPLRVVRHVWPYLVVLGSFVLFVYWNGGVVLGDKSNHVATLHLPQMLYIWPFLTFFSAPLLIPWLVLFIEFVRISLNGDPEFIAAELARARGKTETSVWRWRFLALCTIATIVAFTAVVHFNTIIHPFTLADNRHYMFYVFRYTILYDYRAKYILVIGYFLGLWAVWSVLTGFSLFTDEDDRDNTHINHPLVDQASPIPPRPAKGSKVSEKKTSTQPLTDFVPLAASTRIPSSTAMVFLVATALSLVTAPLVEPRYFIIPWVIFRLNVPSWQPKPMGILPDAANKTLRRYDCRLFLETAWFLLINVITGYLFLAKPFYWRSADGTTLDDGRQQRFIW